MTKYEKGMPSSGTSLFHSHDSRTPTSFEQAVTFYGYAKSRKGYSAFRV
jgi:hypothetical protein